MTRPGLGDILSDLNALAAGATGYGVAGGLGPWIVRTLTEFRALPNSVNTLSQQIQQASNVLTQAGAGAGPAAQQLRDAQSQVDNIRTSYPGVAQKVSQLTLALLPVMSKIQVGTFDTEVLTALLGSGVDIVATVYSMNSLIGRRDQAQQLIQDAVTNPTLPPSLRDRVFQGMAGAGATDWLKLGALALIGFVVIKSVMRPAPTHQYVG